MDEHVWLPDRRPFLRSLTMGSVFFTVPDLFAEQLVRTPAQTYQEP